MCLVFMVYLFCRDGNTRGSESPAQVFGVNRLPLSEIPMNPISSATIELRNHDCHIDSCPKVLAAVKVDICTTAGTENEILSSSLKIPIKQPEGCVNLLSSTDEDPTEKQRGVSLKGGVGLDSFVTPVRQFSCSSLSEPLSLSTVLDDDFDESILEEIDALCDESAAKSESKMSNSTPLESQHVNNNSGREKNCINLLLLDEKFNNESVLNSSRNEECVSEISRNSETQIKSMPEEYAKYIKSLNDRQQEAACSDISTPLMIVAGPGSGKVSSFH